MVGREAIEAQIAANVDDVAAYEVLADVLQAEGDPRGELIAIEIAAARAQPGEHGRLRWRRAELLARHPELAPPEMNGVRLDWRFGFVRQVTTTGSRFDTVSLFRHPSLRFASELVIDSDGIEEGWIATLTASMPGLRQLTIGNGSSYWIREEFVFELERCVHRFDQIETLSAGRSIRLTRAPALRRLELFGVMAETIDWLKRAELPVMTELALSLKSSRLSTPAMTIEDANVVGLEDLRWLLAHPPRLVTTLAINDATFGDALIAALVSSPLLRQLRVLRLWNAGLTVDGARGITREAFGHLELLDLSDPTLDDAAMATVAGACPEVRTVSPRLHQLLRR